MARLGSTTVYGDINVANDIDVSGLSKFSGDVTLESDLVANNGETIWDESATYIPQGRLQNDTVTIEGNAVSLGGSTTVNHNDLSTISSDDHHSRYTDGEARTAIENGDVTRVSGDGDLEVYFDSGNDRIEFQNGSGNRKEGLFSRVYLQDGAGWFDGAHSDLSGVGSSDHHSKTSSASELSDVSPDSNSNAHHHTEGKETGLNTYETISWSVSFGSTPQVNATLHRGGQIAFVDSKSTTGATIENSSSEGGDDYDRVKDVIAVETS